MSEPPVNPASPTPDPSVTMLLRAASSGERRDVDALLAAIYDDLRRLAASHLHKGGERSDHTLHPTALVHEAYLRLIDQRNTDWRDRVHFFALASRIIRRILVDHARERNALKRGGKAERVDLSSVEGVPGAGGEVDMLALDAALAGLAEISPQQARIVELRFFGGLTVEETAELLGIGKRTVDREWAAARAWLYCELGGESEGAGGVGGGDGA